MINLSKYFILVSFLVSSLLSAETSTTNDTTTEDVVTQKYIKEIPNEVCRTYIQDDNARKDDNGREYRFILDNFNYKTGFTKYNVYKQNSFGKIDQDNPIDTISFTNDRCVDDVSIDLWIDSEAELFNAELEEQGYNDIISKFQEIRNQDNPNSDFNKKLRDLELRYLREDGEFLDTGNKKFLTTSSYILACLSFDEDIINIKKSIELNKITLQDEYTIYPNSSIADKELTTNKNPRSQRNMIVNQSHKIVLEKLHSISEYISESIVLFAFKFRVAIDPIILKLKGILLLIFLPSTLGLLLLSKISKKISDVSDFDDVGEKVVMALFLFIAFYISDTSTNKTVNQYGEDKAISVNFHQDKSALLFSSMMDIANETSNIFSASYINFKRSSAGFSTDAEMNAVIKDTLELEKMRNLLVTADINLIDSCTNTYNTNTLKLMFDLKNVTFPTRGQYDYWKENAELTAPNQFYINGFNDSTKIPSFTIQMCNQFERDVREIDKAIAINKYKLDATAQAFDNKYEQDQLLKIARIQYKSSGEMGVISLPQTMSTNIVTDNLNMFGSSRTNEKLLQYMKEENEKEDYNDGNEVSTFIFENLAYMMIPGTSTLQEMTADTFKFFSSIGSKLAGGLGFILKKVINMGGELASTVLAIITMKSILEYFPIVALSMASLMVISWYYISVFIYFLVSPFVIVYVIATQQTENIKSYLIRGIVLSFKPLFLIMSIVVALVAVYLINDLSIMMFEGNFSLLIDVVSNNNATYSFTGFLMQFFKGLVLVGSTVVGIVSAFYLVFNGAEMILGMFGFKDMGIDVKEVVGGAVEGKTGKYSTPGV